MEQPKVSVVVPIYNVEAYLDRCIEAVVSQTYRNLEIILVNDGSTDRCPEICEEWVKKDSRIKVVHKTNAGLGMARNTGIENATGDYIFFLDSDDYVDRSLVKKCIDCTENGAEAVLYGSATAFADGTIKKKTVNIPKTVFEKSEIRNELLPGMYTYSMGFGASCCMKMFSMAVIRRENLRFYSERELISEDAFFVLEYFSKIDRAAVIPENLYYYYKRAGSLTTSYRKDRQPKNNMFLEKSLEYVDAQGLPQHLKHHITARYHMYTIGALKHIARCQLSSGEKKLELRAMFRDPVLRSSLKPTVLKLHKPSLRVFFSLLKIKAYPLCKLLLSLKG